MVLIKKKNKTLKSIFLIALWYIYRIRNDLIVNLKTTIAGEGCVGNKILGFLIG